MVQLSAASSGSRNCNAGAVEEFEASHSGASLGSDNGHSHFLLVLCTDHLGRRFNNSSGVSNSFWLLLAWNLTRQQSCVCVCVRTCAVLNAGVCFVVRSVGFLEIDDCRIFPGLRRCVCEFVAESKLSSMKVAED
jgi:hypothetical protein